MSDGTSKMVGAIIGIVIISVIVANLLPLGLDDLTAFTNSNSSVQTIVTTILPILIVIGIALGIYALSQKLSK